MSLSLRHVNVGQSHPKTVLKWENKVFTGGLSGQVPLSIWVATIYAAALHSGPGQAKGHNR
jgi:hypothetical protein